MSTSYLVLSMRGYKSSPAHACVYEFEDVMVRALRAELICAPGQSSGNASHRIQHPVATTVVLMVGLWLDELVELARRHSVLLSGADQVCAYVFDAMLSDRELNPPQWKRKLSWIRGPKFRLFDHFFVPIPEAVDDFTRYTGIKTSYLPIAADALQFAQPGSRKCIAVNGYGRQDAQCSRLLSERLNASDSPYLYYHTDHMHIAALHDYQAHRRMFWKLLNNSAITMAFDTLAVNPKQRFTRSFVGQRWFESIAAGCVVVGRRPTSKVADELLSWPDSTIELPENIQETPDFIVSLLSKPDLLHAIGLRNQYHALQRHDWRHRIATMLDSLCIDFPPSLSSELAALSDKADQLGFHPGS